MRILQIESDQAAAQSVELMLKAEGMSVYTTDLGEEGVDLARLYDYDLVMLELNLPDLSGLEVIRQMRHAELKTPILVLSSIGAIDFQVRSLNAGADAYATKPIHKDLLLATMRAVLRRARGQATSEIKVGDLVLDLERQVVSARGRPLKLTQKERQVLRLLIERHGSTVPRALIINHLYAFDPPDEKIVDVFLCKIRKKIADAIGQDYIETVWGKGYMLHDPDPTKTVATSQAS